MTTPNLAQVKEAAEARYELLTSVLRGVVPLEVVDEFIRQYCVVGPLNHYSFVPHEARETVQKISDAHGGEVANRFLQAALVRSILISIDQGAVDALTPRVRANHVKQFGRIVFSLQSPEKFFALNQDIYLKEMGLATLRLLAGAAQLIDVRCGVPRSLLLRQGWRNVGRSLIRFAGLKGFRPFMQIHTHDLYLDEFNEAGWNECYLCCAEICEANPTLLGMFGSSWFYDPVMPKISPRLAYLQQVPASGGADFWFFAAGGHSIALATGTSPSRRKLYEEGHYLPTAYMMVWGSQGLVSWARERSRPAS